MGHSLSPEATEVSHGVHSSGARKFVLGRENWRKFWKFEDDPLPGDHELAPREGRGTEIRINCAEQEGMTVTALA